MYDKPPIEEAICQLTFDAPLQWSVAAPGLIYQALRSDYPAEPEEQEQVQAGFEVAEGSAGFSLGRRQPRIIFRSEDGKRLVIINRETVSVNSLSPYEGWNSLSQRLERVIEQLSTVGFSPMVRTISVRYINRVTVPEADQENLETYFRIPQLRSYRRDARLGSFVNRAEFILPDEIKYALTFASALHPTDVEENVASVILDLDLARELPEPCTLDAALAIANEIKEVEGVEFESLLTNAARERFK